MEAFFGALGTYRRTIGSTLSTAVQAALFQTRARNYDSTVQRALDGPNLPPSVQTALVDGVNAHLSAFHRYLTLRKRILGVSELHYYDLYAPLVAGVPLEYSVEQAQEEVKRTTALLGDDYVQALDRAFKDRWIDYYPTTGKQSGAYRGRLRLRRASLHAVELQRPIHGPVDPGARSRTPDAQLFLGEERSRTRRPAIPRLSPRWPRRSTKRCSSSRCWRGFRSRKRAWRCSATISRA